VPIVQKSRRPQRLPALLALLLLSVLAATLAPAGEELPLTILHFNDLHGQLDPVVDRTTGKRLGGIARLAGLVRSIRSEDPARPVILLFAGDLLQGTVTSTVFLGSPDIGFLSEMGVDAAAMGNHELDYGQEVFRGLLAEARFPVLGANLLAEPVPFPLSAATLLHPPGGPLVGVLGLVTEELTTTTHPRNTAGIRMVPPAQTAAGWVPWLRARSDLVVVLSHLGLAADRQLAQEAKGIDLIVGGHDHLLLAEPQMEQGVPILQAGARGEYLGRLDLSVRDGRVEIQGYRTIPIDDSAPEDPAMAAAVAALDARLADEIEVVVGHCATLLDADRAVVRRVESNFGDWVGDLARRLTGADVALFNGGTFRASIGPGEVRIRDIYEAFPFGNELVTARIPGSVLQLVLDRSAVLSPLDNPGGFLQVSGVRFAIEGGKAQSIEVAGRPLDPAASYLLVVPDFLAAGGDGYDLLKDLPDAKATGLLILDMVTDAFRAQGAVAATTDGRLTRR
jgi:2',3'-cyclic-nucleotide 2'-phosphodiesterase (5'-nucleotidase family)